MCSDQTDRPVDEVLAATPLSARDMDGCSLQGPTTDHGQYGALGSTMPTSSSFETHSSLFATITVSAVRIWHPEGLDALLPPSHPGGAAEQCREIQSRKQKDIRMPL